MNAAFVDAYRKQTGKRANFMAVSGYDGMHLIYEALGKRPTAITAGDVTAAGNEGHEPGTSPRGPMSIDRATGDVVHNIYIRKVEKVGTAICKTSSSPPSKRSRTCGPRRNELRHLTVRGGYITAARAFIDPGTATWKSSSSAAELAA